MFVDAEEVGSEGMSKVVRRRDEMGEEIEAIPDIPWRGHFPMISISVFNYILSSKERIIKMES